VSYEDGQLTIVAANSTLADILNAVGAITGATMDVPSGSGNERVWVQLGPGPARAILAAMLGGTDFDYVIQASDADPTLVQNVLLSLRSTGVRVGQSAGGSQSFASRMSSQFRTRTNSGRPESNDWDSATSTETSAVSADGDPSGGAAQGNPQPTGTPSAQADTQPAAVDATTTGTPSASLSTRPPLSITETEAHPTPIANVEQAIPQMQNLFELRRQLQQQQNAQQKTPSTQ
jgi:hypothetical protein